MDYKPLSTERVAELTKNMAVGEKRLIQIYVKWEEDRYYDISYLDDPPEDPNDPEDVKRFEADQIRKAEYGDTWWAEGCIAIAQVVIRIGPGAYRIETFKSSPLWGIESDSRESYKVEIQGEQIDDLKSYLKLWGVPVE